MELRGLSVAYIQDSLDRHSQEQTWRSQSLGAQAVDEQGQESLGSQWPQYQLRGEVCAVAIVCVLPNRHCGARLGRLRSGSTESKTGSDRRNLGEMVEGESVLTGHHVHMLKISV